MLDAVNKYIESQKGKLVGLVKELVSIPTLNPPGDNYDLIVNLLEQRCKQAGLKTNKIKVADPELEKYKIDIHKKRVCLIADWDSGCDKTIHINAHYDVVPCAGGWKTNPFKPVIKNEKIYARGTEDMKASIACYLTAVCALKKYNIRPGCNLQFSFVPDEETGGETGFGYLVKKGLVKADYGITEGYSGRCLSYGNKGVVWLKVQIAGKAAHASKPHMGINSFEKMNFVVNELMKLNKKISRRRTAYSVKDARDRFSTMVLGGVSWGGEKTNIVPNSSGFTIDRRFLPEENLQAVKNEIYECIKSAKKHVKDLNIKVEILLQQNCAVSNPYSSLSKSFTMAIKSVTGKNAKLAIMSGATDMRFLMAKGTPCIGYSVSGGNRCHANDEYVTIKSLIDTTKVFAYVFANLGKEKDAAR
ncbi:MAG: ArgE/DapE family deacylase [Candidatus Omnitrophota bacterium]